MSTEEMVDTGDEQPPDYDYIELDEAKQVGRRIEHRRHRIDLARTPVEINLADILLIYESVRHTRRRRMSAAEFIDRLLEALLDNPNPGSVRLVSFRVPVSGRQGLGKRPFGRAPTEASQSNAEVGPGVDDTTRGTETSSIDE